MKIKHVMWDWNGTLLNDRWLSVAAINRVLTRYELPEINEDRYLEIFKFPVIDYYEKLGFDFTKDPFEKVGTEFIHEYESQMHEAELFDQAIVTLDKIDKSGLSQSILSAGKQKMLDDLTVHHQIHDYFKKIVGQDNHYAFGKSEAGRNWIQELGIDPDNVIMVGDTVHDAEVAEEMSVHPVLIPHGHATKENLILTGATVLDSIEELGPWIDFKNLQ